MGNNKSQSSVLELFLPPVQQWFRERFGDPTPAQEQGWPGIVEGKHTLILAPTGSGKTLASFLACLDSLWRQNPLPRGVQVLYISPLKALNNDIHRNLQVPLEGVANVAQSINFLLPVIETGVRTGDTPTNERQRMVRRPPHVLITTPESLHLLLTSKGRETLRNVRYCIVDEIHSLCTTKRGVFLSLLLERLEALNPKSFVRIGLSATQRPLEEVARYLGGLQCDTKSKLTPREVTIVDAGIRKEIDLQVTLPVERFGPLPEGTVWPSIYRLLRDQIHAHESTIIFAKDRRSVERITACVNDLESETEPESKEPLVRAHHGSVSLEVRRDTEQALKDGKLKGVVATASLEMGIDMGAVDLVCQVTSPNNVARGLQRVGRAGHLVGQKSKGRLIPHTMNDLLEQAVLAREMMAGNVEYCRVPTNALDILCQQIVGMVAMENWEVSDLHSLVRQAYPYRDLTPAVLESVLEMITGRYRFQTQLEGKDTPPDGEPVRPGQLMNALQPRISWDRVNNRLLALPGTKQLAVRHAGAIPDTGQYGVYNAAGLRLGELDEEFVYEIRVGEAFLLGTNSWRVDSIDTDRIVVSPAEGAHATIPFWRGEGPGRTYELGTAMGEFLREIERRFEDEGCQQWLQQDFHLSRDAAWNLRWHVLKQVERAGCLPSDKVIYIEACRDQLGDWQLLLLSPFGNRLHLGLRYAFENRLRHRLGYRPKCLHHNDGILIRLTESDEAVLDVFEGITAENVQQLIIEELIDSPLFALRFRQNAARSLILPSGQGGRRAPLWLQRLRGRDLLQVARKHPDFPVVVETFRECLNDYLDLPRIKDLVQDITDGNVQVVAKQVEAPSPFASGLLFAFTASQMYETDSTESDSSSSQSLDQRMLEQLLSPDGQEHLLDPRAINQVERRLRSVGQPPRSKPEMAEWLRRLGDLATDELEGPMAMFLEELREEGVAALLTIPVKGDRWILAEETSLYERAFGLTEATPKDRTSSAETILVRFLNTHALVGLNEVLQRYPFDESWATKTLHAWTKQGRLVSVSAKAHDEPVQWATPDNLDHVQRSSLGVLRKEVLTLPAHQFADFVLRWQGLHPETQRPGPEGLLDTLETLQGLLLPASSWEEVVFPSRQRGYNSRMLDELLQRGEWTWFCQSPKDQDVGHLAFVRREAFAELPSPVDLTELRLDQPTETILQCLQQRGALYVVDLAQQTGQTPSVIRRGLWKLLRAGLVTNDRFDPVRAGEPQTQPDGHTRHSLRRRSPQRATPPTEGRWSLIPWASPDMERQSICFADLLLGRYGVATRDLAKLDSRMPPWRVLYEVLSRMELAGTVRRGYFVEGLAGAQFALPQVVEQLQESAAPSTHGPAVLMQSLDPANVYGSGAPFDIPLLDGGTRSLLRRPGNWLVMIAGRPVLLVEQQGKKLTALPSASREHLAAGVKKLPELVRRDRALLAKHKMTVSEWNGQPVVTTEGRQLLEEAGFVRDLQDMTLYAAWS
ncbi:MAG: DEAD/DEAH box helicase [Gemmataceae bacterium]